MFKEVKSDKLHQMAVVGQENDKKWSCILKMLKKKKGDIDIQDPMKELNSFKMFLSNWEWKAVAENGNRAREMMFYYKNVPHENLVTGHME